MAQPADLPRGTPDRPMFPTVELRPLHGVGISDGIEQVSHGFFVAGPGSLFPGRAHLVAEKRNSLKANTAVNQAPAEES